MNYLERKKLRKSWYEKYVHGNKLVTCTACDGSGYYDHNINGRTPKCGSCNGTGKTHEKEILPFCLFKL